MPLLANFERPEFEDNDQRAEASSRLAQGVAQVHLAVAAYEEGRREASDIVKQSLRDAQSFFRSAMRKFDSIESNKSPIRGEFFDDLDARFPAFAGGYIQNRLGSVSVRYGTRGIRSDADLLRAATDICRHLIRSVESVGTALDGGFEARFRSMLVDMDELHRFAVFLSEAHARSFDGE